MSPESLGQTCGFCDQEPAEGEPHTFWMNRINDSGEKEQLEILTPIGRSCRKAQKRALIIALLSGIVGAIVGIALFLFAYLISEIRFLPSLAIGMAGVMASLFIGLVVGLPMRPKDMKNWKEVPDIKEKLEQGFKPGK